MDDYDKPDTIASASYNSTTERESVPVNPLEDATEDASEEAAEDIDPFAELDCYFETCLKQYIVHHTRGTDALLRLVGQFYGQNKKQKEKHRDSPGFCHLDKFMNSVLIGYLCERQDGNEAMMDIVNKLCKPAQKKRPRGHLGLLRRKVVLKMKEEQENDSSSEDKQRSSPLPMYMS